MEAVAAIRGTPALANPVYVTFSGGNILNGFYGSASSQFGCANFPRQLKLHFSQPVSSPRIQVSFGPYWMGDAITNKLTANTGEQIVLKTTGYDHVENIATFEGDGITEITITNEMYGTNPDYWWMWISQLEFTPDTVNCKRCNSPTVSAPSTQTLTGHNWSMDAVVSANDGLILRNVKLGNRYMAEEISVPYYTFETSAFPKQRGELKPDSADPTMRSRLVNFYVNSDNQKLVVEATYIVDRIPATSKSCLQITQRYEFYKENLLPCEPSKTISCSNYKSIVKYKYSGLAGESLTSINVVQRNRYKVGGYDNVTASLFKDCDGFGDCIRAKGLVFKDKQNPLFTELNSPVIRNGRSTGSWDNAHLTFRGTVDEPLSPTLLMKGLLGGCPECVHKHWRWGSSIAEDAPVIGPEPLDFNNFQPMIPQNSTQDLDIGIAKYKQNEADPTDYTSIISSGEQIRHTFSSADLMEGWPMDHTFSRPDGVVLWYSATGRQQNDTFFMHTGFFYVGASDVIAPINRMVRVSASEPEAPATSSANRQPDTLVVTESPDGPNSVRFANQYQEGATTFAEIDPSSVAPLPAGYALYGTTAYDVSTEAIASGLHTITFGLSSVSDTTAFSRLRILHAEVDPADATKFVWVDRTILSPDAGAPDFASRTINARANYMGPFVIASLDQSQPPVVSLADLSLSVIESADPVTAGHELTYTFSITNNGPQVATDVMLVNGLSPYVDYVSSSTNEGFCTETDAGVNCKLNSLNVGASANVTLVVQPGEGGVRFPASGIIVNHTAFVRAKEGDNTGGNNFASVGTTVLPESNAGPTINITSPTIGSKFVGPANITITANASDGDGSISKVDFFDNGELIGNGTLTGMDQYSFSLTSAPFGSHTLIARATDNLGKESVSSAVHIIVNGAANVSISGPGAETVFNRSANINITANASYSGGNIGKVDFYANGSLIGAGLYSGANQYGITWANAPAGRYALTAVARDDAGIATISNAVNIIINDLPTVNLVSPAAGAPFTAPVSITLTAQANDGDQSIRKVDFYANGALVGSGLGMYSYSYPWNNVPAGNYTIVAVATDLLGATATSSPINVRVTAPPTVNITAPVGGSTYIAPATINISANAADSDGSISKVEFYADGNFVGLGTASGANQYSFTWSNVPTGAYSLTAVATDSDGSVNTSAPVRVLSTSPALLIAGSTTLNSSDAAIKSRMEALGYIVTVKSASSSITADATNKALVVISSTVTPTSVGTKFVNVAVPVVLWESGLFYNMGMTSKSSSNFGTATSQTQINIINSAHPLAAGLSGRVSIITGAGTLTWGKPNANAASIATLSADTTRVVIFGYEKGVMMPGMVAPARRIGLFMYDTTAVSFTNDGGALFDAAVKWAAGR
jgi:uncharacterized repeat protein (TIGR01451 family)